MASRDPKPDPNTPSIKIVNLTPEAEYNTNPIDGSSDSFEPELPDSFEGELPESYEGE